MDDRVATKLAEWLSACSPTTFRSVELEVAAAFRELGDEVMEVILNSILSDEDFFVAARKAARRGLAPLRNGGARTVRVTLLGGRQVSVRVDYLRKDLSARPGPKRGHGRRGKAGSGVYPALAALGIEFSVTPALAAEATRQVTDSNSLRAGQSALKRRGIDLEYKQLLRVVNAVGARSVEQRDRWLADVLEEPAKRGPLKGQRVVIAIDGGRLRERVERPGRRRAETRHHCYDAPWREPKVFTIYTVDAQGRASNSFRPVYDGTLDGADAAFAMMTAYLKALGAHEASTLTILGDGAKWIWERTAQLVEILGLPKDRVREMVDWFHATEHLGDVAKAPAKWDDRARDKWLKKAKDILHTGDINALMAHFDTLAIGRRATAVNEHRAYFQSNASRMRYREMKDAKLPLGSGAVESAIRMVVNLRLKSAGKYWLRENAQSMLLLRSYLKSERFDELFDWSASQPIGWWAPTLEDAPPSPVAEALS